MSADEETRTYLQARLAVLFRGMFWSFFALIVFLAGMYALAPDVAPARRYEVYAISAAGLAAMAFIWRFQLVRKPM